MQQAGVHPDPAAAMKDRMRADLRIAMKERRPADVAVLRALMAALDNAEAVPIAGRPFVPGQDTADAPTEVERLYLDDAAVRSVLVAEIAERDRAAGEMERLGQADRAATLRAEVVLAGRYLD